MSPEQQNNSSSRGGYVGVKDQRKFFVEICQNWKSTLGSSNVEWLVKNFLLKGTSDAVNGPIAPEELYKDHVDGFKVYNSDANLVALNSHLFLKKDDQLHWYTYRLHDERPEDELLDEQEEELPAAMHWMLPSKCFLGTWDALIYDTDVKQRLLNYACTSLKFAEHGVDQKIVSWNRVILLHGPPGTGKTTLCHALAQKLAIRLSHKFKTASMLEVNSHSLFSKWFSESGKLVMKMFKKVEELLEDENHLVCLLIDEVESLAAARAAVTGGTDPSDAVRVVNALLTQIDRLKHYKNVLILTTSNVTGKIDLAFVDRADIKFFIDFPSANAIYAIYRSCLDELAQKSIIHPREALHPNPSQLNEHLTEDQMESLQLWEIAQSSVSLSGRTLRKLPFLAHAANPHSCPVSQKQFLADLADAVKFQFDQRKHLADAQ